MSNPWTPTGGAVRIATPTYSWEKVGSGVNEGPTTPGLLFLLPEGCLARGGFGHHARNDEIRKNFRVWENLSGMVCVTSIDRVCRPRGPPLPYASR
ncbi:MULTISPECIES: hypothetical protein [unclassified Streptomyces]|uniref:hypothetical protein n=1 Tax=unclassified Streptomyces TaxID=2593676 RepID=UPI00336AADE9